MGSVLAAVGRGLGSCMSCTCLGDKIFGTDVDVLFAYQTPKVVKIYDRSLGILKFSLMLFIFVYIVLFNMFFKGSHFAKSQIQGLARLQWQEPTKDFCNPSHVDCESGFADTTDLHYCSDFAGSNKSSFPRSCDFYDARELPINFQGGSVMPTYIMSYEQTRHCTEGERTCKRKWTYLDENGQQQTGTGDARPTSDHYVANLEDFTLLIDHSFRTWNGKIAYDDYDMAGSYKVCNSDHTTCTTHKIKCIHKRCAEVQRKQEEGAHFSLLSSSPVHLEQRLDYGLSDSDDMHYSRAMRRASTASVLGVSDLQENVDETISDKDKPNVVSITNGDVLSMKTILAMAGTNLDRVFTDQAGDEQSIRSRGTAIVIDIHYDNKEPFRLFRVKDPPSYLITVTSRPVEMFKHVVISDESEAVRTLRVNYGVFLVVKQEGDIVFFDPVTCLVTLTAALALLAASNLLTDFLALSVLPKKDIYNELKYQESEDLVTVAPPQQKIND